MINQEILEKLQGIIYNLREEQDNSIKLNYDTNLIEEYGLQSLEMISLLLAIEDGFEVQIDFENLDIKQFESLESLHNFVCTLLTT